MQTPQQNSKHEKHFKPLQVLSAQAFRPFFLFGAAFADIAIALWLGVWIMGLSFQPAGGIYFWHQHEMAFGFVLAIIIGFLLTAVQNWTGQRATHGKHLILLFSLWALSRLILLISGFAGTNFPANCFLYAAAILDCAFLLMAALHMGKLLIAANNRRNLFFMPLLLALACLNGLSYLGALQANPALINWGVRGALFIFVAIMCVIGGRVIPMFSANGTGTQRVEPIASLEKVAMVSTWAFCLLFVINIIHLLPNSLLALFALLAGLSQGFRCLRWRFWVSFSTPLVWSLHFAYAFIPLGFLLLSLHYANIAGITGFAISFSTGLHALTAGAMGSLILAMLARVSLGHTGRPLKVTRSTSLAFACILIAGSLRIISGLMHNPQSLLIISGLFWLSAFSLFIINYFKILTSPRADGREG